MSPRTLPIAVLLLAAASVPAAAHTKLVRSEPADGQVVAAAPAEVVLHFGGPVQAPLSKVTVLHDGKDVRKEGPPGALEGAKGLRAPLREGLGTGAYEVRWTALSADGHEVDGTFRFEVKAAPAEAAR